MNTFTSKRTDRRPAHAGGRKPADGQFRSSTTSQHAPSYKGGSSRRNFGRGRGKAKKTAFIDESKFINKASENNYVVDYAPKHKFIDFKIDERLKKNILEKGFVKPTAIQDKSIPEILHGKDVIGLADTGTGKTAAFLIPLINKMLADRNERVLIMAPTRELAQQINMEFIALTRNLNLFSVAVVGGANIYEQVKQLRRGYNVLIGTPGRLKDLANRRAIDLTKFTNAVLDEADRMLDMGFIPDMRLILSQLPKHRQTLFFTATLSKDIEQLAHEFLNEPVKIETKLRDTSSNVDQNVIRVGAGQHKIDLLHDLLVKKEFKKVLIFAKTKIGAEKLLGLLKERGFRVESIHGDKTQSSRQRALKAFKEERIQILVATDVAARGLDIPEVTHVINYDLPSTYEDYIHRIGRTGRAHHKGVALTFIGGRDSVQEKFDLPERPQRSFDRKPRSDKFRPASKASDKFGKKRRF